MRSEVPEAPDVMAWMRTRMITARVLVLCVLVATAAVIASPRAQGLDVVGTVGLALLFVFQFRLWDDLADLPHDRIAHPERPLSRAGDLRAFQGTLVASIVMVFALLFVANRVRCLGYGLLVAVFALMHSQFTRTPPGRMLRDLLVLLKYPAFVLLLADWPLVPQSVAAAVGLYAILCVHAWQSARADRAAGRWPPPDSPAPPAGPRG